MGYGEFLREMLRPVGVYDLDTGAGAVEIEVQGRALDDIFSELERAETEAIVLSASGDGLSGYEEILPYSPISGSTAERRAAIAALLRIDEASFTLSTLQDTLRGIGLEVAIAESDTALTVIISFPAVRGIPGNINELTRRIEMILPCHLGFEYRFVYLLWSELEQLFSSWQHLEAEAPSWRKLESY